MNHSSSRGKLPNHKKMKYAMNTARMHFSASQTMVMIAGTLPTERSTLVKPALPLPISRISTLPFVTILVTITAGFMLPIRYAMPAAIKSRYQFVENMSSSF